MISTPAPSPTPGALLASSINDLHRTIQRGENQMKHYAADIGMMLIDKKAELKHGEFIPWV
ncbi:hypothetical protein SAMN04488030_3208 [Aliiroseovarius halocynthiae]|uniref:DUF3102 domain-containing protein n=1 Tax=Aliiroseovarius halocynthiae TaxID=985055 RepID=A0A545SLZ8_9RHOB|nr:hypothetical protein [Aliiroseovarius halocynthiae]TQV66005.1 hypothetical protein FIL88_14615 [Aliiroseovarius halocynthiae]SMR83292.1 hypothetical protein SAMN04488030_3208 [Aliiroseovarius halocynthiae]